MKKQSYRNEQEAGIQNLRKGWLVQPVRIFPDDLIYKIR